MKLLIFKQKAAYLRFQKLEVVEAVREAGYEVLIEKENDNVGYYGQDYLFYYVEVESDEEAVAFKLRFL